MGLNLQTHVAVHWYVHLQVKILSVGSGFRARGERDPQGGCELFDVGAGNRAWDFSKSSLCSQSLSHLSSPIANLSDIVVWRCHPRSSHVAIAQSDQSFRSQCFK